jgi:hypothetical protein
MAALMVAAEGAHLYPGILDFYLPELPKHVSHLFTFEAMGGCGMGELAEFKQEGEWCSPGSLLPIEMEVREMVTAILEGLPELFG